MKNQYYFSPKDAEICYNEIHFHERMKASGVNETKVFKAEKFTDKGLFWCKKHLFCGDGTSDYCGKSNCEEYSPRNGKSGRCRYHSTEMYKPGEEITLNLNV